MFTVEKLLRKYPYYQGLVCFTTIVIQTFPAYFVGTQFILTVVLLLSSEILKPSQHRNLKLLLSNKHAEKSLLKPIIEFS